MAKSPAEMTASMIANLKEKTGRDLPAWTKIAARSGCEKHGQLVKHLKEEHGVTHGYANLIAHSFLQSSAASSSDEDLLLAQYAGPKAALRPIYDALIEAVRSFGPDVEVAPKKAYVSLRRSKQFALVQPSTRTRVDLGLNLAGDPTTKRLEASGSFNAMCTHRVRLSSTGDVDRALVGWLRSAYERA